MTMAEAHDYLRRRSTRRSFLRGAAAVGGAAALGPVLWQQPGWAQAALPGSPRLTFGNDPTTTMSVSWSTPAPVANPRLSFGPTDAGAVTIAAESATVSGLKSVPTNYHHVRLSGLQPGTTYRYRLLHDGGVLDNQSFTTGIAGAHPLRSRRSATTA
jgi:phosphodiesterase/alkaline phosphatase D-like protein